MKKKDTKSKELCKKESVNKTNMDDFVMPCLKG